LFCFAGVSDLAFIGLFLVAANVAVGAATKLEVQEARQRLAADFLQQQIFSPGGPLQIWR
jgi:hypothetical protein